MKRSNLFLSLTTGLLALASFAFAKSQAKSTHANAYCRNDAGGCDLRVSGFFKTSTARVNCPNGRTQVTTGCVKTIIATVQAN